MASSEQVIHFQTIAMAIVITDAEVLTRIVVDGEGWRSLTFLYEMTGYGSF